MGRRLRVPLSPLRAGRTQLDDATSRYVARVHRRKVGDEIDLFDPEAATEATATIAEESSHAVVVDVGELRRSVARPRTQLVLLQALGKGDKPEQVIRDATVLGARRVVLVESERTVARGRSESKHRRGMRTAVEAARQSGRGDLPVIEGPEPLSKVLDEFRSIETKVIFCFHQESRPLLERLSAWDPSLPIALLVGPEGGFSEEEVALATEAGFAPASLGPFVLRTETAATVALGITQGYAEARAASTAEAHELGDEAS